jgi:biopolymer transport protein ExbB/TolQ
MREARRILKRAAARSCSAAPFVGAAGTLYGIHDSFRMVDTLAPARTVVLPGIASSLVATVALMLGLGAAAVLHEMSTGSE